MIFTEIKDIKYSTPNNTHIDLLATCKKHGEIPMTLNLVDTEDLHTFVDKDGKEYPLEEYCKKQSISPYTPIENKIIIPTSITMRQCRLYLLNQNLLDDVENIVSENRAWQIEWEYANEVLRTNQLITAMQSSLNLIDEQVDTMFLEASKL